MENVLVFVGMIGAIGVAISLVKTDRSLKKNGLLNPKKEDYPTMPEDFRREMQSSTPEVIMLLLAAAGLAYIFFFLM